MMGPRLCADMMFAHHFPESAPVFARCLRSSCDVAVMRSQEVLNVAALKLSVVLAFKVRKDSPCSTVTAAAIGCPPIEEHSEDTE